MSDRPPLPSIALRVLVALALEAALLTWGLGGLAALADTPRAWALIAVWGVTSFTLARVRPARGQAVERAERDALAMAALALLPLVTPAVAAWGGRARLWPLPAAEWVGWCGVALSAAGLALRVAAMRQLGARFSPLVALQSGHTLETGGWYALVRHPGYLGALLASLGAAVAFGSAAALPLVLAMTAFQVARVRREERLLAERFGEAWSAYAERTPALWPWPRRSGA
jgi:protein-S-isoprenylcysteine O-methyltransferase Ste14